MIVSVKHRFIFLSMPKCASSAIVRTIRDSGQITAFGHPGLKHTPYRSLERFVMPYITDRVGLTRDDFTVICLFREPISWLHSWFRYRSRRALKDPAHRSHANYTGGLTFNEFAAAWLSRPRPPFADVGRQSAFVLSLDRQVGPDVVYRYEELDEAVRHIGDLIGRRVRVRRVNRSPRHQMELDDELRLELTKQLGLDYEIYDGLGGGRRT